MPTFVWILLLLVLMLLLYGLLIRPTLPRRDVSRLTGVDYAHRGLWNAQQPENSMAAFRSAVENGFGIELDVHLTRDGHLVVHHDASLKRICGEDIRIEEHDLARIRQCRLGHSDEPIPTFDEVLALVNGQVPLIVELKVEGNADALCRAVHERMQRYDGPWCMESFHPSAPRWFRLHAPDVIRGLLAYDHLFRRGRKPITRVLDLFVFSMLGSCMSRPDFIAYEAVTEGRFNLPMLLLRLMRPHFVAWTIRSQADMDRFRSRYDLQIFEGFMPRR